MSHRILKYDISNVGLNHVAMPRGARLLHVHIQGDGAYLWAEVDEEQKQEIRTIRLAGTGASPGRVYLGTIHTPMGYVWHVYDETEEKK